MIALRFCTNCGHQFKEEEIDARMEIPGVNVGEQEEWQRRQT